MQHVSLVLPGSQEGYVANKSWTSVSKIISTQTVKCIPETTVLPMF